MITYVIVNGVKDRYVSCFIYFIQDCRQDVDKNEKKWMMVSLSSNYSKLGYLMKNLEKLL